MREGETAPVGGPVEEPVGEPVEEPVDERMGGPADGPGDGPGDGSVGEVGLGEVGLFGPESVSWRVLREGSVMIGGLRALLLHAAHPLVVAGARQTGMYERDPWKRLERTLRQTFTVVFGTRAEALSASRRIDDVHGAIKGVDEVTGKRYDARDPALLLWVHACLVDSFLEFERRSVGRLDDEGRQRFHVEQMVGVELLRLPSDRIPPTHQGLRAYIDGVIAAGTLRRTADADKVADVIRNPPAGVPRQPLWRVVAFLAFHTLPPAVRELYGVRHTARHEALVRAITWVQRRDRPLMPPNWRFIAPAVVAGRRLRGVPAPAVSEVGLFLPLRG